MMKKNLIYGLLTVALMLGAVMPANGQWRYGVRVGGAFAAARLSEAEGYSLDNRSGFSGGLVLEYTFAGTGVAPDVAVVSTRYNTRLRYLGDAPQAFGRNFLEVPVHLKYKIPVKFMADLLNPMLYTGPSLAFKLGGGDSGPLRTKGFQPRWDFGVGVSIVNFIQISGGYSLGLGNAVKSFDGRPDARLRTDGWHLTASILFDF